MMLNLRQRRMLELLDVQISFCKDCSLYVNGHAKPYWTSNSEYMILGEAPGADEIKEESPFVGRAGRVLWDTLARYDLHREQFLIINSVNCRPVDGKKNGKPTLEEMEKCKKWILKYMKVVNPSKILLLGGYAIQTVTGLQESVIKNNAQQTVFEGYKAIKSVHPAYTIYNKDGIIFLEESIKQFKELEERIM